MPDDAADRNDLDEQAAAWRLLLENEHCPPEAIDRFQRWMEIPGHRNAFRRVEAAMLEIGDHVAAAPLLEMRRAALTRLNGAGRRTAMQKWVAAAILPIALAAGMAAFVAAPIPSTVYETRRD